MKTASLICLFQFVLFSLVIKSQNGLENVIIEKYYVSNENDTAFSMLSGKLPIGSITYRIYLDMLPEYRFHAAYGSSNHELKIETSTVFYNNEDVGNTMPNLIPRRALKRNTVMLDSWLSAGAAGEQLYGILKEEDDSIETVVHEKLFLQNKNKKAGIAVSERDGLIEGSTVSFPVFFGLDSITGVFFNSSIGSSFKTNNGAWGSLGGAVGRDSLNSNRLLIAQLTTNGDLEFELNIQIGKRGAPPENYVAKNPTGKEITLPFLTYRSKEAKLITTKNKKPLKKDKSN